MSLSIKVVDHVPAAAGRRGPRSSFNREVLEALDASETGCIAVAGTTKEEAARFYRGLMQFRIRHRQQQTLGIRKDGLNVYLWRVPASPFARDRDAVGRTRTLTALRKRSMRA